MFFSGVVMSHLRGQNTDSNRLKLFERTGVVVIPCFTFEEKQWINHALKMYKEFRKKEGLDIAAAAHLMLTDMPMHELQLRVLFRAVSLYKMNVPESATMHHGLLNVILNKLKGVLNEYGLDSNESYEGGIR